MDIKKMLYKVFLLIFLCAFFLVWGKVLFKSTVHNYNTISLFIYMSASMVILFLFYLFISRYSDIIKRYYKFILAVFLIVYGIIVIINGFLLRFTPSFDMDAIYGGAIQWLKQGSFSDYYEYYGYFPNNLGAMLVLHTVFYIASVFGITDFFGVGIVFNSLIITITAMTVSLTCKKLRGGAAGIMALMFFVLCIPFLFMGAAFYTDSLSLLFPVMFYYLYLHFKEQKTWKKKVLFTVLMAIVLTTGMLIKFTVLIILVAVVIDGLLSINLKEICLITVLSVIIAFVSFNIMDIYMYSRHMDKKASEELNTPYLHWVMMGLQNYGYYSPGDYEYTRAFTADERNQACFFKIKERINEMGFKGLTELFINKADVCFGDGTFALSDFLDDTPDKERWLHKYILYEGVKYSSYQHLVTGILLGIYLFMLIGTVVCLKEKETGRNIVLAPRMAGLGILSFLILWETSGRYFTNFVPLLLVCAVLAFKWKGKGFDV